MRVDFTREIALKILFEIDSKNAYSNVILDEYMDRYRDKLNNKDINLISELVYGITTWKLTIDVIIQYYSKIKLNKISTWIKNILRMGIYQIVFLDKIPKSAAVNESVNLTKKYGFKSANFVNAILRRVDKEDYEKLKLIQNDVERLSKLYSMPLWMVEKIMKEYGDEAEEIVKASNFRPKLTIRINSLKIERAKFIEELNNRQIEYEESKLQNFIYLKNMKNLSNFELFKEGFCTVQDEGAGEIVLVLNPKENETVLDACSAPGGKTTYMAELMKNRGKIVAWDVHEHRLKLVQDNAKRLAINIIETQLKDATKDEKKFYNKFDKILLDVPCLGLGVIKRKPDIKWQRKEEDIESIAKIQLEILTKCCKYLKKNGEIVYSTCSILKEENQDIIQRFLENEKFRIVEEKAIKPAQNTDGFYICKLSKC